MIEQERIRLIMLNIQQEGSAEVETLAKTMHVSPMTIRRDLAKMAKQGLIERCHGGALLKREQSYREKQTAHRTEKICIAKTAAPLIEKKSTVFLDAGTTTGQLALLLRNESSLTVVTADLEIARILTDSQVRLIVCGGEVQKRTGSMLGFFATHMLSSLRFDIAFIGTACIDRQFNVLTPTTEKAALKQCIVQNSRSAYVLADASKFYRQAMLCINSLADYTALITNKMFTDTETNVLKEKNITVIQAPLHKIEKTG